MYKTSFIVRDTMNVCITGVVCTTFHYVTYYFHLSFRGRLLSLLPRGHFPAQQPSTTTKSTEGGSRLSTLAKRGSLHLSIPSNTLQSQVAPSNPSTDMPAAKHRVKMPAQLTKSSSSSTLTAQQGSEGRGESNGNTNSSFPLPWKQQGVSLKSPTRYIKCTYILAYMYSI